MKNEEMIAIQFAEWASSEGWQYDDEEKLWHDRYYIDLRKFTSEELFGLFKKAAQFHNNQNRTK